jgi:predicted PurR-regulated permease PerM
VEIVAYTAVAILLYFLSDWILRMIEARMGRPLPQRSVVFFVILLVLALVSFSLIRSYLGQ